MLKATLPAYSEAIQRRIQVLGGGGGGGGGGGARMVGVAGGGQTACNQEDI